MSFKKGGYSNGLGRPRAKRLSAPSRGSVALRRQPESIAPVHSTDLVDRDPRFKYFGGLTWAVFNCRESDKRKGRKAVLEKFGVAGWKKVMKINRTGIMAMFQVPPTPETQLYADTVGVAAESRCAKGRNKD